MTQLGIQRRPHTPVEAHEMLKLRVKISVYGNLWADHIDEREKETVRQIEIGMYMIICAAFERFLLDYSQQLDVKRWFHNNIADNRLREEFKAYWAIRNAMTHYYGDTGALDRWPLNRVLENWGVNQGDDFANPYNNLIKLWSGLVNFMNDVMKELGLPEITLPA